MYGGRALKGELCNKVCMYVCMYESDVLAKKGKFLLTSSIVLNKLTSLEN